ncbi:family 16 glycosylhydrolase [Rubrobacter marinus]|uniref:licheninase n=1 Tax=Rubrobacter marinus TaxID=2653852 RepID=A0A6G8PZQ2_9ACTN|nr:glycoside hydrolase family 16 protein [Rubrobacter marinus]QIN79714.1 family 16 glycosylhydrolase [Rubrobacter marinus]
MARRGLILLVIGLVQVGLFAGLAGAGVLGFADNFDTFDTTRWKKTDHALGRGFVKPANVSTSGGYLRLKLPANTVNGGEIMSNVPFTYGSYTARMKLPNAPSSITGFFLYEPPDYASEIDIEIFNDASRKVLFTTYSNGRQTHSYTTNLPFDPTAGFHSYRFDYAPGSVKFYADGKLMKSWNQGVPRETMHLYANAWFPKWLGGRKPATDRYVLVDRIQYTQP